jgi:hypothetical protein
MTNYQAPMFKLVRVKLGANAPINPNAEWEVVIEEDPKRKLEWVSAVDGDKMFVCYNEDVKVTFSDLLN